MPQDYCLNGAGVAGKMSRWREPPVRSINPASPEGARDVNAQLSDALSGLDPTSAANRWLAPPANFHCASGTGLCAGDRIPPVCVLLPKPSQLQLRRWWNHALKDLTGTHVLAFILLGGFAFIAAILALRLRQVEVLKKSGASL